MYCEVASLMPGAMCKAIKPLALTVIILVAAFPGRADERLRIEGTINDQQIHLIFDTGADRVLLFPKGAKRLGLTVIHPPPLSSTPAGKVGIGITEPCDLTLFQTTIRTPLAVLDIPDYLPMKADGAIGWGPLSQNVLQIDAADLKGTFLSEVPADLKSWLSLPIQSNCGYLFLKNATTDCSNGVVLVDTGFSGGVALAPSKWKEWNAAHPNQTMTLDSYFMPGAGLVVNEERWASKLQLGPLTLTDVPIMEANIAQISLGGSGYQASLGLAALKRLDLVIDGPGKTAYLRLKKAPAPAYDQNRLGAVFVPTTPQKDALLAHVAPRSPAFEAGIRDGDVLLKIGQLEVTHWRTSPGILPLSKFWEQPAGTQLRLTLARDGDPYRTTVCLREILESHQKSTPASRP